MRINSTSSGGNFIIEDEHELITELRYKNWLSSSAKAFLNEEEVSFLPKNMLYTKYSIFKNGFEAGELKLKLNGDLIFKLTNKEGVIETFYMNQEGFWKPHFLFLNESEELIFKLRPSTNWKRVQYNYTTDSVSQHYQRNQLHELLLLAGFGANRNMALGIYRDFIGV